MFYFCNDFYGLNFAMSYDGSSSYTPHYGNAAQHLCAADGCHLVTKQRSLMQTFLTDWFVQISWDPDRWNLAQKCWDCQLAKMKDSLCNPKLPNKAKWKQNQFYLQTVVVTVSVTALIMKKKLWIVVCYI